MRPQRPPRRTGKNSPQLPSHVLRDFCRIEIHKKFLQEQGGVFHESERVMSAFKAALLPLNNEDLQRLPDGTGTVNSQKLYTNGDTLQLGQLVRDQLDGQIYTVMTELTHQPLHGLRRYVVTKRGAAASGK